MAIKFFAFFFPTISTFGCFWSQWPTSLAVTSGCPTMRCGRLPSRSDVNIQRRFLETLDSSTPGCLYVIHTTSQPPAAHWSASNSSRTSCAEGLIQCWPRLTTTTTTTMTTTTTRCVGGNHGEHLSGGKREWPRLIAILTGKCRENMGILWWTVIDHRISIFLPILDQSKFQKWSHLPCLASASHATIRKTNCRIHAPKVRKANGNAPSRPSRRDAMTETRSMEVFLEMWWWCGFQPGEDWGSTSGHGV